MALVYNCNPGSINGGVQMALVPEHIFREYDIRGIADTELTDEFVMSVG